MAGHVLKRRRLANPRRRMTANQIRFFGTRRQKAALKNRRRNRSNRANRSRGRRNQGVVTQAERAAEQAIHTVERAAEDAIGAVTRSVNRGRRANVGEILTVVPANPGRRRNRGRMARTANRRRTNRTRNRGRARNRTRNRTRNYRRHRNRTMNPKVIVRYRNRRHNRRNRGRRRNPGLSGDFGKVIALLGGAAVTSVITGFLPTTMTSGYMGYVTTGITAVVAGQVAGRALKMPQMATWITVGGLLIVGLQLLQQFFPHLSLPLFTTGSTAATTAANAASTGVAQSGGTSGLGLITSSNFFVPQVNMPGSMASFVAPAAIPAATVVATTANGTALHGLGQGAQPILGLRTMRRTGRMR